LEQAMGEMRIKIEDEVLLVRLANLARAHDRSIDEEVIELLRKALENNDRFETSYEAAVRIAAMTPKGAKQTDSVEMLREDRDR
jgi:plasmid stability protein